MEPQYAVRQPSQGMDHPPFFYYTPDPKPEHRQHGHFSPHPNGVVSPMGPISHFSQPMQTQTFAPVTTLPSNGGLSRPSSSSSPAQGSCKIAFNQLRSSLTPVASPQPMYQKPTILIQDESPRLVPLDTDCVGSDMYFFPSTPPLSTSGSAINSPPSTCGVLATPVTGNVFFGLDHLDGVKEGCEHEVKSESLIGDWARMGSPPMTPVFIHPPSVTATQAASSSSSSSSSSDLLLSTTACPSLSPSPSPPARSSISLSEGEFDFCDPRHLTVTPSSEFAPQAASHDFPPLPTLCAGDDEEHKLILGGECLPSKSLSDLSGSTTLSVAAAGSNFGGLAGFDEFSDLDSDDDFVNGLVQFTPTDNTVYHGSKRQRTDLVTFETDSFSSEGDFEDFDLDDSFAVAGLPSPSVSSDSTTGAAEVDSSKMKTKKAGRVKKAKASESATDSSEVEAVAKPPRATSSTTASNGSPARGGTAAQSQPESSGQQQATGTQDESSPSDGNAVGSGSDATAPTPIQTNRRGRKQSLTEDPSKTFVCDLCSRRFRRQEHLKRHYRSLHTHDKPFECNECGKKFSRSDNLSQHARTHGSGAIVMGVFEDGEIIGSELGDHSEDVDTNALGVALFEAAHAAAGSTSGSSDQGSSVRESASPAPSDSSSSRKKRKRDE